MDYFEYLIVGSGPSGVSAARHLAGQGVCLIDAGASPQQDFVYPTLQAALSAGDVDALLGTHWEMLGNLIEPKRLHPKLRAAGLRFVMSGEKFRIRDVTGAVILRGAGSHAVGGMSNVWGAQLLRYTDVDLAEAGDWPINAAVLEKYYSDLEEHIGISGQTDDMYEFLGASSSLLPPILGVPAAEYLYEKYRNRKAEKRRSELRLGRPRLALTTTSLRGRAEYGFGETEFFTTGQPGLYTARRTLNELLESRQVSYLARHKLLTFSESSEYVELELLDLERSERRKVRVRHLLLACGTIQTAQLILLNRGAFNRPLPFIDHTPTLLPIFMLPMIGSVLPNRSFPVQLVGMIEDEGQRDMISFYYPGGLLWSDLLPDIPLPLNSAQKLLGTLLGGMLVAQIWETARPSPVNNLSLEMDGGITIDYAKNSGYSKLKRLIKALRPLGAYTLESFAVTSPPGWGFHHAGSLPMRIEPREYETHVDGRLWDSKRVRVIDGSVLPSLPAKNHSLTLMANAARIADEVKRCGY